MLEVKGVSKRLGNRQILDNVSFKVHDGEFVSLLGPTGCGKTTLLRIIAGHEFPDTGQVLLYGQDITRLPAFKRNLNTVFQRYALFPHMNVYDNVAFGLRCKKIPESEIKKRVMDMLAIVKMENRAQSPTEFLSGGEQQRVALIRALVNMPQMLLLDEPLSAVDAKMKASLQAELLTIQKQIRISFLFVTHDQGEALLLSDRIALLNKGRIAQMGTGPELYEDPQESFVARFIGQMNFIPCHGTWNAKSQIWNSDLFPEAPLRGPKPAKSSAEGPGFLAIRPEKVSLYSQPQAGLSLQGHVDAVSYLGTHVEIVVQTKSNGPVKVFQQNTLKGTHPLFRTGSPVFLNFPADKSLFFADDGTHDA